MWSSQEQQVLYCDSCFLGIEIWRLSYLFYSAVRIPRCGPGLLKNSVQQTVFFNFFMLFVEALDPVTQGKKYSSFHKWPLVLRQWMLCWGETLPPWGPPSTCSAHSTHDTPAAVQSYQSSSVLHRRQTRWWVRRGHAACQLCIDGRCSRGKYQVSKTHVWQWWSHNILPFQNMVAAVTQCSQAVNKE